MFELFVRKLPSERGFLMAAGLETALDLLERMRFTREEIEWLERSSRFGRNLLDYLEAFRFTGR